LPRRTAVFIIYKFNTLEDRLHFFGNFFLERPKKRDMDGIYTGMVNATWRYRKWNLVAAVWFRDMKKAEAFEEYLKQGSGHAFANRHLW
jgi:hypothetical protein